ncbi:Hypothetical predicted protein [Podarcis lilfordi]|uniref:Uncharacterized protein n=1 Tax=Podarcis lilfordi TaxID=74358 RepID=A0AA35PNX0_9SAUR|nr:Hypothetical predicted protein [Podarcis lilfordi]
MRGSLQTREHLPSSGATAPDEFEFDTPDLQLCIRAMLTRLQLLKHVLQSMKPLQLLLSWPNKAPSPRKSGIDKSSR